VVAIHKQGYTCRKADQVIHPDHETPRQVLERHLWEMRGLVVARGMLAEQCPSVAAGRARLRLAVRENEFTVNHRPVHLRILLAECFTCPDPEPLEPIMPTDPAEAELVHAAALNTLGRLRYYAQTDPNLRGLMEEFDAAVGTGLDIPPVDVAARTSTEPLASEEDQELDRLLEATLPPSTPQGRAQVATGAAIAALKHLEQGHPDQAEAVIRRLPGPLRAAVRGQMAELAAWLHAEDT
jgi:hypothetical protein